MSPRRYLDQLPLLFREIRADRGLSQRLVAEEAGLDASVIRRAERGRDAKISTWIRIFDAMGIIVELTYYEDEEAACMLDDKTFERQERRENGLRR